MPRIDLIKRSALSSSGRGRQLEAMFDVPRKEESVVEWHGEIPIDDFEWNIGLIVGPSGSGKSSILQYFWGAPCSLEWKASSVIDDFDSSLSIKEISEACSAVGFNTIPAWLRPYAALSNGEKFRVELARRLTQPGDIVLDEFTSIVDRQVAQIASYAVQKYIRRNRRRFIAASCHYDILDWLQPDWILEPSTMSFQRRSLQRRPELEVSICRVPYSTWSIFAPFHYMSAELHKSARCFGLFVGDRIAAFVGVLYRPRSTHKKGERESGQAIYGVSRVVTLPDWQGLGLGPVLCENIASAYKAVGYRFRNYPAHPSFVRTIAKSQNWKIIKKPGQFKRFSRSIDAGRFCHMGGRPCAIFEYVGPAMDYKIAKQLLR